MKIAVIGTGWADKVQIPAFQHSGNSIVGVYGRNHDKAQEVAQRHGIPTVARAWEELLETDAELISITTPPRLHKEQTIAALQAGKHVLVEKPLAMNQEEVLEMIAAQQESGLKVMIDHELRFVPVRKKAKALVAEGFLGELLSFSAEKEIVSTRGRLNPETPFTWWSDAKEFGGALGALGSHVLDGLYYLLGDGFADVELRGSALARAVKERRDAQGTLHPVTADDLWTASLALHDAVGSIQVNVASHHEGRDHVILRGTEGTIKIDSSFHLYVAKAGQDMQEIPCPFDIDIPEAFSKNPFPAGSVCLGAELAKGIDNPVLDIAASLEQGLTTQRIMDEARKV